MKKKEPIRLYNLTDLADNWGVTRGASHKSFHKGHIVPDFTHYHGPEVFWDKIPSKPTRKKK